MHLLINFTYLDQLRFGLLILARLSGIIVDIKSLNEIVMHIERVINSISAYAPKLQGLETKNVPFTIVLL